MSGFTAGQGRTPFVAQNDLIILVTLLEAFPQGWTTAREAAQILQQFVDIVTGPGGMVTTFFGTATGETMEELVRPCVVSFTELLHQFLGKATCFQSIEYSQEIQDVDRISQVGAVAQQQSSANALWLNGANSDDAGVNEESVLGYGWGSWDLDFL